MAGARMRGLRLHGSPTSPYMRKVRVLLAETGQTEEVPVAAAQGSPRDLGTIPTALNPLGKIPVLERPDGAALFDSRVICRYLNDRAGATLYPPPPTLWEVLTMEAMADGMLDAAVGMVYEGRLRGPDAVDPTLIEAQWTKIARAIVALENRWLGHLHGRLTAGQIALGVALGYLDFRHAAREWRSLAPGLARWAGAIHARESFMKTAPPSG